MSDQPMRPTLSRFGGNLVAVCDRCGAVCGYWDESDLDESGRLMCDHAGQS